VLSYYVPACVYVYMYGGMYDALMYLCTYYVSRYVCTDICMHVRMNECMFVCVYVYIYIYIYICTCVYVGIMCLYARPHTNVQPRVCIALTHKTIHAVSIFSAFGKIFGKPKLT
jgi:hypothetical protein